LHRFSVVRRRVRIPIVFGGGIECPGRVGDLLRAGADVVIDGGEDSLASARV
jgi:imidazole glycerol phosphate synthase subunit HisF